MVKWYWKCKGCGSIVIQFDKAQKNQTIAVTEKYIKDNNIDLTNAVRLEDAYDCENCFPMEKFCEALMKIK